MEWINNISNWFQENCGSFLMWLQTFDIVGIITAIVLVIKQYFATKGNTQNVELLNASLNDNSKVKTELGALKKENSELRSEVKYLKTAVNDVTDSNDKILSKINSMLDVYALVYQTIKNEDTRVAVNNILMNARYNETATRQALVEKIEQMQENIKQLTEDAVAKVNDVAEQSKQLLVADDKNIPRG